MRDSPLFLPGLPPCPDDIDPAFLPDAHEPNDDGSTSYGTMLQCGFKYREQRDTGLQRSYSMDDPLDFGQVVHYGHQLAWRSVAALQAGGDATWPLPVKATLAAMYWGVIPALSADGWARACAAFSTSLPDYDQEHGKVIAVEQQGCLALPDGYLYKPTLDLVQQVALPSGQTALMFIDHKTSAKRWGRHPKRLFELHIQFIGMAALGKFGGWIRCLPCGGSGCYDCEGTGWQPLAALPHLVAVNFINSREPFQSSLQVLTVNRGAVDAFATTLADAARRREQYTALEEQYRSDYPDATDDEVISACWPRTMMMYGPCGVPFKTGLCDLHEKCCGEMV